MKSIRPFLVVIVALFANFMESGTISSFGVVLNEITRNLDVSVAFIGLVFGLSQGAVFIFAPLNVPLIKHFGPRWVGVTCALLATTGFVGASFSINGAALAICLLLYGSAYSGIILLAFSCPADYCPDRFDASFSIISTGGGIGSMVMPFVINNIDNLYGWRGTFLLIGAFHLHVVLFGALMKPILKPKDKTKMEEDPAKSGVQNKAYIGEEESGSLAKNIQIESEATNKGTVTISDNNLASSSSHTVDMRVQQSHGRQEVSLASIAVEGFREEEKENDDEIVKKIQTENDANKLSYKYKMSARCTHNMEDKTGREPIKKLQVSQGSSFESIPDEAFIEVNIWSDPISENRISPNPGGHKSTKNECCHSFPATWACVCGIDLRLFRDFPMFFAPMAIQGFLSTFGFVTWTIFVIPNAEAKGISPANAVYISIIGAILSIVGRFLSGLIIGRTRIKDVILLTILCLFHGLTLLGNFVANGFWSLGLLSGLSGLFIGGKVTMTVITLKNNLPEDRFRAAVALLFLILGIGVTVSGYTLGALYDITTSYELSYGVGGAIQLLSAFILLIPIIPKCRADIAPEPSQAPLPQLFPTDKSTRRRSNRMTSPGIVS